MGGQVTPTGDEFAERVSHQVATELQQAQVELYLDGYRSDKKELINNYRSLMRITQSPVFKHLFFRDFNNAKIRDALNLGDIQLIRAWMGERLSTELGDYSLRKLRALAAGSNIPNYSRCTKDELIILLTQEKTRRAQNHQEDSEFLRSYEGGD